MARRAGIARITKGRRMKVVRVYVGRTQGSHLFTACVNGLGKRGFAGNACVKATNPRKAVAGALRKAATIVSQRSGAFASYRSR